MGLAVPHWLTILYLYHVLGNLTRRRGSLNVHQEAAGHRSGRFRARTHPLDAPEQPGSGLGKFHFQSEIGHFSRFRLVPGKGACQAAGPVLDQG